MAVLPFLLVAVFPFLLVAVVPFFLVAGFFFFFLPNGTTQYLCECRTTS